MIFLESFAFHCWSCDLPGKPAREITFCVSVPPCCDLLSGTNCVRLFESCSLLVFKEALPEGFVVVRFVFYALSFPSHKTASSHLPWHGYAMRKGSESKGKLIGEVKKRTRHSKRKGSKAEQEGTGSDGGCPLLTHGHSGSRGSVAVSCIPGRPGSERAQARARKLERQFSSLEPQGKVDRHHEEVTGLRHNSSAR